MKLATLPDGSRDGRLMIVSRDHRLMAGAADIVPSLQRALETWGEVEPALRRRAGDLERGSVTGAAPFDPRLALAPLPRAYQWLDGSAFMTHLRLMALAGKRDPVAATGRSAPLMYQGGSDSFLGPAADIVLPSEDDGIDFEAEVGVILDDTPMGVSAENALDHVRLLVLLNDVSLRHLSPLEFKSGFGWVQAKPSTSFGPLAVTPDELGAAWKAGRVHRPVRIRFNGQPFGHPDAGEMKFSFADLIHHAARTRSLCAGTIIGSGTISNDAYGAVGSACIAERRAIETIEQGEPRTAYMKFGDRVEIDMAGDDGASLFGAIDQVVRRYRS